MAYEPRIVDAYERFSDTPIFIEIVPPQVNSNSNRFERHCSYLNQLMERVDIDAVNIPEIQNESQKGDKGKRRSKFKRRVPPREYAKALSEKIDTHFVINRVIVKEEGEDQEDWLLETGHEYDAIDAVALVGGESSEKEYPGPSVTEGNRLARGYLSEGERKYDKGGAEPIDLLVGNICIPTRRSKGFDEPDRMLKKVKAGADFFTTQILGEPEYAIDLIRDFSELLQEEDIKPPLILWSFTPIASQKDVDFLRWLGAYLPDEAEERILSSPDPAGESLRWASEIWTDILEANDQLVQPFPMGCNISVMGMRNFGHAIDLAEVLQNTAEPVEVEVS